MVNMPYTFRQNFLKNVQLIAFCINKTNLVEKPFKFKKLAYLIKLKEF